jgi:hypothetical protein
MNKAWRFATLDDAGSGSPGLHCPVEHCSYGALLRELQIQDCISLGKPQHIENLTLGLGDNQVSADAGNVLVQRNQRSDSSRINGFHTSKVEHQLAPLVGNYCSPQRIRPFIKDQPANTSQGNEVSIVLNVYSKRHFRTPIWNSTRIFSNGCWLDVRSC